MARGQTVFSELTVALGIINGRFNKKSLLAIKNVGISGVESFLMEMSKYESSKNKWENALKLLKAGQAIGNWMCEQGFGKLDVSWIGHESTGSVEQASKDLEILNANWRISIKENSNILINGSPERVFEKLPLAETDKGRGKDWFLHTASDELQSYFSTCNGERITGCTTVVDYYERTKNKKDKRAFSKHVAKLHREKNEAILNAYSKLCEKVSLGSTEIFNNQILKLKAEKNYKKKFEIIFHEFFRVNSVRYILAGIDKKEPFVIILNPSSEWGRMFEFLDIKAISKKAGQPEVLLRFYFKDKTNNQLFDIDLKAEIRWSHGKFCGNPECKLYKPWRYKDLPWVKDVIL
ncbi:MAG: hypothetical protein HQK84_02540 [Nitrospinae bacterium]|nr:hypothetical protein [Nitrospinota bacterium]